MRRHLTTLAEVVGALAVATGVTLVSVPAGVVAFGVVLMGAGYLAGDE